MSDALRVEGLVLKRGAREILRGVALSARGGDIVVLMGASGSGKTTILRCIAGLETPDAGTVKQTACGMVFQFHCLFEHLTAIENVTLAPIHVNKVSRTDAERRAMTLFEELGVSHRATARPAELSGGEAQRVAIARVLAMDPPVLLMDEPTASLDPARRSELAATLKKLAAGGRALILTSHDEDFVEQLTGARIVRVVDGRATES